MLGLVTRVCPRWLVDQAEDIVQTALTRVLDHGRRRGNPAVSTSYLMKAAHNAVIDEIRRKFRRPEVAEAETGDLEMAASSAARPEQIPQCRI